MDPRSSEARGGDGGEGNFPGGGGSGGRVVINAQSSTLGSNGTIDVKGGVPLGSDGTQHISTSFGGYYRIDPTHGAAERHDL